MAFPPGGDFDIKARWKASYPSENRGVGADATDTQKKKILYTLFMTHERTLRKITEPPLNKVIDEIFNLCKLGLVWVTSNHKPWVT